MTDPEQSAAPARIPVGIWTEFPAGTKWANEGMSRLIGFIIEGGALGQKYVFRIVLGDGVREAAEDDLRQISAVNGVDYTLHSPNSRAHPSDDYAALARYANANVKVEGWISMFPYFTHAASLDAPVATIFPDAIPAIFPVPDEAGWGKGGHFTGWRKRIGGVLEKTDRVITFSRHVGEDQVCGLFGVPAEKLHVVYHAPPDLAHLAPYVVNRRRTPASRKAAADILRAHARERGWAYLADYPFEEVDYLAVSTQDRVTKNIRLVAEAVRTLVREQRRDVRLFMTTPIHYGATWTPLPRFLETELMGLDVQSMPELPRDVHAAFFHCAAMSVHPSVFEGGTGTFPFYEGCSVGTPTLMAAGPHVQEMVDQEPDLAPFVFDTNDRFALVENIRTMLAMRDASIDVQGAVFDRLARRTWADVASDYAEAAIAGPPRNPVSGFDGVAGGPAKR